MFKLAVLILVCWLVLALGLAQAVTAAIQPLINLLSL